MDNNLNGTVALLFGGVTAMAITIVLFIAVIALAFYVIYVIGLWKLFKKAGEEGWKAIIPFYNTYTLITIVGLNWWWFLIDVLPALMVLIPGFAAFSSLAWIAQMLVKICIASNLSLKMNQSTGITVLLVIFPGIMYPVLGLGSSTWDSSIKTPQNGVFGGDPL